MQYDFETIINRHGMDAIAVDPPAKSVYCSGLHLKDGFSRIPTWIADMSFPTVPTIQQAMVDRIQHPTFGYFEPREEYYESIIAWQDEHNGVRDLKPEYIGYENGVLGGIVSSLRILTSQGGTVLVNSPTYVGFTSTLKENGFCAIHSSLFRDEKGIWRMDYDDMERKIRNHHIHVAIFCSPHNPTGRVWERWEIEKALELFSRYDVYVISDEIWSDLILPGHTHIPTQSISPEAKRRVISFYSPSKTFNIAGLIGSYHIVYDSYLRDRLRKESTLSHYNNMNLLSMYALIGAYTQEGRDWLKQLLEVIQRNIEYSLHIIRARFTGVSVCQPEGTYLLYMDCTQWLKTNDMKFSQLFKAGLEVGVDWQNGENFLMKNTIRMNLALPFSMIQEVFDRLDKHVFNF